MVVFGISLRREGEELETERRWEQVDPAALMHTGTYPHHFNVSPFLSSDICYQN